MLCDALKAGAALATTTEEKAALLDVTRTLARKYGYSTGRGNGERARYNRALTKATLGTEPSTKAAFGTNAKPIGIFSLRARSQ